MSRVSWSAEEDSAISELVSQWGLEDWTKIAVLLRERVGVVRRTGKQCRERWYNHLSPSVSKLPWSAAEEQQLFASHRVYGNRWKDISRGFVGRTDNDIKNHFYSTLRRSLRRLNKIVGEKNSTTQMREIKPSVLSTIMAYIYQQAGQAHSPLLESLKDLPILVFEFAKFKPVKMSISKADIETIREKTSHIFHLVARFNQDYEVNKATRRSIQTQKRNRKHAHLRGKDQDPNSNPLDNFTQHRDPMEKQECEEIQAVDAEKTGFTLQQQHFDDFVRQEEEVTPMAIFHPFSPKSQPKDTSLPYLRRTFSLEADDIDQMNFQEPEEPSKPYIEEEEDCYGEMREEQGGTHHSELVDEVIETHFGGRK